MLIQHKQGHKNSDSATCARRPRFKLASASSGTRRQRSSSPFSRRAGGEIVNGETTVAARATDCIKAKRGETFFFVIILIISRSLAERAEGQPVREKEGNQKITNPRK